MENQGQVPSGNTAPAFWLIPMKTVQQTGQVFVLAYVNVIIAHLVGYCSSITLNSARLKMSPLKKEEEEVCNLFYRGRPEVHLILLTPSDKNGPL